MSFEINRTDVILLVLKLTPKIASLVEYTTLKTAILPRVQQVIDVIIYSHSSDSRQCCKSSYSSLLSSGYHSISAKA